VRGGGNFGVVVSFLFKLHPITTLYGGPMLWDLDRAEEIMRWYRDFITTAPETLNGFFAFLRVSPAPPFPEQLYNRVVCGIVWYYTGPEDRAESTRTYSRRSNRHAWVSRRSIEGTGKGGHAVVRRYADRTSGQAFAGFGWSEVARVERRRGLEAGVERWQIQET
jgi:hypothetical protein